MELLFVVIVLILSVVIHEVAHGYAALWQGDPTAKYADRLTFNPINHLDLVGSFIVPIILTILPAPFVLGWAKPVPINPYNFRDQKWGEAWVALAGPASNIVVAVICGVLIRFISTSNLPVETVVGVNEVLGLVILINLILAIFNLLPIPPLDGSKVLFALLPPRYFQLRVTLEQFGILVILAVLVLVGGLIFPLIQVTMLIAFDLLTGQVEILGQVFNRFINF